MSFQETSPPAEKHIASQILFQEFCDLCEKIKNAKNKKVDILHRYIDDFRKRESKGMNNDFFPILRMLLPQNERERGAYGIKENTLARMYIRVLNLPNKGREATKLTNYKAPSSSQATAADFADVAYYVLKSRCNNSGELTIQDVNDSLDKIASLHADRNQIGSVDEELTKFVSNMTALQQKWLIRIILKDIRLGIGRQKILTCFHVDASDLYDSSNSLSKVCSVLHSPTIRLHEVEIELFAPFRPMLSERLDITKIKSSMKKDEEYFIEMKFDGERFQIHMKDNKYKYFSRNGYDFTPNFGESYNSEGLLTKYLEDTLDPKVHSFIVDGEMMGWHKSNKVFGSKGMTFDVKKMSDNSKYRPCFCAFDILLLNDVILTGVPLTKRLSMLDGMFTEKEGVIIHSKRVQTQSCDEVLAALNKAIDDQDEGIVLKNITSLYKPNSRKQGWFKIKPEYTVGTMNELDLLIIGGYYTENKRHGLVKSVLLGVAVPPEVEGDLPTLIHSVGCVTLSLRAEETEELCSKLQPHWRVLEKGGAPPDSICWTKEKPDLWIEPQHSVILQIKASELTRTSAFKTDFTLRFPRIEKVRFDKPWHGCMTTVEFAELTKDSYIVEKLTARHIEENELTEGPELSPRKRAKVLEVGSQFKAADVSGARECSTLYSGKEVCIMTGNSQVSKADLEIKVAENAGKIVQNPGPTTFCVVAGNINARVNNIIKCSSHNVATVEWFLKSVDSDAVSQGSLPPWTPRDLIGTSSQMTEEFALKYDQFGDSYSQPATLESLKYSMKRVSEVVGRVHLLPFEFLELDKELFGGAVSPHSFLRGCDVHIITDHSSRSPADAAKFNRKVRIMKFELDFFGGSYSDGLTNDGITHILVPPSCGVKKMQEVQEQVKNTFNVKPLLLSLEWLESSLKNRRHVKEDDFLM